MFMWPYRGRGKGREERREGEREGVRERERWWRMSESASIKEQDTHHLYLASGTVWCRGRLWGSRRSRGLWPAHSPGRRHTGRSHSVASAQPWTLFPRTADPIHNKHIQAFFTWALSHPKEGQMLMMECCQWTPVGIHTYCRLQRQARQQNLFAMQLFFQSLITTWILTQAFLFGQLMRSLSSDLTAHIDSVHELCGKSPHHCSKVMWMMY